jgi:hypothetical protein
VKNSVTVGRVLIVASLGSAVACLVFSLKDPVMLVPGAAATGAAYTMLRAGVWSDGWA